MLIKLIKDNDFSLSFNLNREMNFLKTCSKVPLLILIRQHFRSKKFGNKAMIEGQSGAVGT